MAILIWILINIKEDFHWENLISSVPDITSHSYKKVRDKLVEMQEWLYEINNAKYNDTDNFQMNLTT